MSAKAAECAVHPKYYWNWIQNCEWGANFLKVDCMNRAKKYVAKIREGFPTLRDLTAVEYEHMAICLYGPNGRWANASKQYYWVGGTTSNPQWVVNHANNDAGVSYTDLVFGAINNLPQ